MFRARGQSWPLLFCLVLALPLCCRPRESGDPVLQKVIYMTSESIRLVGVYWVPAFAGTTVSLTAVLHPRMREAWAHLELLTGRILVRRVGRQHDRGRAHALMDRVDAGRRLVLLNHRLGGAHQAMAHHD